MSVSTADNNDNDYNNKDDIPDVCANCGKGEEDSNSLKACTACKLVKYCNRECQIAHRPQHKKECRRRAAELHDEALFKQPPPEEDCPICFVQLPSLESGQTYQTCCGKCICNGCAYAPVYDDKGNRVDEEKCAFCRTPNPTTGEEVFKRAKKRMECGDAEAISNMGTYYSDGLYGLPQNDAKALEFWHRAGELGYTDAYFNIGISYDTGRGVELDEKKAKYYFELAAIGGDADSRYNLGSMEGNAGNRDRALRHFIIAVRSGSNKSLETIRKMVTTGHATKDDYAKALRARQSYLDEIKSDPRDKAAAADEDYKYY